MDQPNTDNYTKWLYLFIGIAVVINFTGLFNPIIGPDGILYANIAKTMVVHHDYINLYAFDADWLDKPHFPFWIAAFSFNLFGFTTWAYKLPAILFLMMGAGYTYLFAKTLYNKQIALWSVLILLTSEHILLSNNDVRAEPYLTGLIIAAVYHLFMAYNPNNFWHLLAGCVFAACAIMTKGMFALIPIGGAIVGHLIITKNWKQLFNLRWLIAAVLILVFMLPEIWCLYQQFDLHPEKVIFGKQQVSGIKFFFWDSQFGRFFNTGPIKGHGDPTFFIHTTLWAFLPWSLLLFAAIYQFIRKGIKNVQSTEWFCISGALLTFLLFSASKFQLPHYLNIVFPFFAIVTAQYLFYLKSEKSIKAIVIVQTIVQWLMLAAVCAIAIFFGGFGVFFVLLIFFPFGVLNSTIKSTIKNRVQKTIFQTTIIALAVNLFLNVGFYPALMHYQAGSEAAMWINTHDPENLPVVHIRDEYMTAMEFYSNKPTSSINPDGTGPQPKGPFLLYGTSTLINELQAKGWHIKPVKTFERYWVSRLTTKFLNKATRQKELTQMQVVLVNP